MAGDVVFGPNLEAEIAVVGGGGAGLAAALAAAEKGARVIVVEKRKDPGGNAAMAEGLFAAESSVQRRLNIDARPAYLFKVAMEHSHWKLNPRIMRAFIDKSGDTIEWLINKGLTFNCLPYYPNQVPAVWHCFDGGGVNLVRTMVNSCQDLGVKLLR
jgi:fumarate reductase flavoprotein subunit